MATLAKLREGCPRVRAGLRVARQGSGSRAAKQSHAMRGTLTGREQAEGWLEG